MVEPSYETTVFGETDRTISTHAANQINTETNPVFTGNIINNSICFSQGRLDATHHNKKNDLYIPKKRHPQRPLSIFAHNVNGLLTKLIDVYAGADTTDYDIFMFTETGLNDTIASKDVFPKNKFETYRCDRSNKTSDKQGKGGVLIAVNKRYKSDIILKADDQGCEQIWVQIKNRQKKVFLGIMYIPPSSNTITYERHMTVLKQINQMADSNTMIILSGDFNLPQLTWAQSDLIENTYFPINISSTVEDITMETCNEIGLMQINGCVNDNERILDLFWTNEPDICVG